MCICEIIILICQELGSVGPVQQQIKLPSPYKIFGSNNLRKLLILLTRKEQPELFSFIEEPCKYCHQTTTVMFMLLCWKQGWIFTAVVIMVFSSWETGFSWAICTFFIVEYSPFRIIFRRFIRSVEVIGSTEYMGQGIQEWTK